MLLVRRRAVRVRGFDLTPMIDVVLQLIIFFMVTSQFGRIARTTVELPLEPGEKAAETIPSLVIDITREGSFVVDSRPLAFDRVVALVEREAARHGNPDTMIVLVRPDRGTSAGSLNRLADELARLGVRRWSIATRAEGGG